MTVYYVSLCMYTRTLQALNFVCQNISRCTPEAKELLYTSLVRPLMEFATPAWEPQRVKDINGTMPCNTFFQIRLPLYNHSI